MSLSFSGHETFACRSYWLKKGLDHVWNDGTFGNDAILEMGVGKNMVSSIQYWLKAYGLYEDLNGGLSKYLFDTEEGRDPYLEDIGSLYLLHYMLVSKEVASIYSLVFNHFRKINASFSREELQSYIEKECHKLGERFSSNSIRKDIGVFLNTYLLSKKSASFDFDTTGLLVELGLIHAVKDANGGIEYAIENKSRVSLPAKIVLACILFQNGASSISFAELLNNPGNVGSVFCLNSSGLMKVIETLTEEYPGKIIYTSDGGVQVLQFRDDMDFFDVLDDYYNEII